MKKGLSRLAGAFERSIPGLGKFGKGAGFAASPFPVTAFAMGDDAFLDVYNKQFDTDIPSAWTAEPAEDSAFDIFETFAPRAPSGALPAFGDQSPRFLPEAPTNPFDRIAPRAAATRSEVIRASLRAEREQFAALGIRSCGQTRNEASAFDLEEM